MISHAEFAVKVGYRPDGWISAVELGGRERLNGWRYERQDETPDGTLLDGKGHPLPPGAEPVYSSFRTAEWGDFDGVDFGELVGEC